MTQAPSDPIADSSIFERELSTTVDALRDSVLRLIQSLGLPPDKSQTIARRLGLRKSLAWSLVKVASEADPYVAVSHVPGPAGMRLAIEAFRKNDADEEAASATEHSADRFYRLIDTHAGDRKTLMSMLGEIWPDRLQGQREADRKAAFQGNSAIWGVQTRVALSCWFCAPNPDQPEMVDQAMVRGMLGLRRLRRTATWPIFVSYGHNDDGSPRQYDPRPLDPSLAPDDAPLLEEFCSGPLDQIRLVRNPPWLTLKMTDGPVGKAGAIDFVLGRCERKFASVYGDAHNQYGEFHTHNGTPAELRVADLMLHRDLPVDVPPEALLFSRMAAGVAGVLSPHEEGELPLHERLIELGSPPSTSTAQVPGYSAMVKTAFDRMGWNPADFRGYRLLMRYPPIPTCLVMRFKLAERP